MSTIRIKQESAPTWTTSISFDKVPCPLLDAVTANVPEPNPGTATVSPVNRVSPTAQVEEFSIQLLIAGPTPEERAQGLFSELNDTFTGPSTCQGALSTDGPDFTLSLNMKGTTPSPGTATLKFCRTTGLAGIGTGVRIKAKIGATLLFSSVKKVVILNVTGSCFNDLSGQNTCLQ